MYVCICNAVTESAIHRMVDDGCSTLGEVQARTGCADCCGTCHDHVVDVLHRALERQSASAPVALPTLPLVA
jgi:bacterioferritin-associated ferredoxin